MIAGKSFLSRVICGILGCIAFAEFSAKADPSNYPEIDIRQNTSETLVFCDNALIVELKDNRFMRFRSRPRDEKWVGKEGGGADLGWAYSDNKAKGMVVTRADSQNEPEKGQFTLIVEGKKPTFDARIRVVLKGIWNPETLKFRYLFNTQLECPLETWYQNSSVAQGTFRKDPNEWSDIEIIDYHVQYISLHTLINSVNRKEPLMYEWFVHSDDGDFPGSLDNFARLLRFYRIKRHDKFQR